MRLSNRTYLIHGTNQPEGVGRRTSAGCIRLFPEDIKNLFSMTKLKTPVIIVAQPFKVGEKDNRIYLEAHLPLQETRAQYDNDLVTPALDLIKEYANNKSAIIYWNKAKQAINQRLGIPKLIGTEKIGA